LCGTAALGWELSYRYQTLQTKDEYSLAIISLHRKKETCGPLPMYTAENVAPFSLLDVAILRYIPSCSLTYAILVKEFSGPTVVSAAENWRGTSSGHRV
jgi:hypothetical protein